MLQLKKTAAVVILGLGCVAFAQAQQYTNYKYVGDNKGGYLNVLSIDNPVLHVDGDYNGMTSGSGVFAFGYTFDTLGVSGVGGGATFTLGNCSGNGCNDLQNLTIAVYEGYLKESYNTLLYDQSFLDTAIGYYTKTFTQDVPLGEVLVSGNFPISKDGPYTFVISGFNQGEGQFSFDITMQAVPEPAEYAMLLAGLGVVGMIARRRKK